MSKVRELYICTFVAILILGANYNAWHSLPAKKVQQDKAVPTSLLEPRYFRTLPSGWDEQGQEMYRNESKRLAKLLTSDPSSIYTHHILPLEPVRTGDPWFSIYTNANASGPSNWEPDTFETFFRLLGRSKYYIGFGTWMGPTLFFAAQLVDEAYGIEADPSAYAKVESNLALNKQAAWAHRVNINAFGVGMGSDTHLTATRVPMVSSEAGNSCSSLGHNACKDSNSTVSWQVNTFSLPSLVANWKIPSTRDLFIKVDVESFECNLIPSWVDWIKSIPKGFRPTFHIAFHGQIHACSKEEYRGIYDFAILFDKVEPSDNKLSHLYCMYHAKQIWSCPGQEFVFYDNI